MSRNVAWRRFRRNPLAVAGALFVAVLFGAALLAPALAPHAYDEVHFAAAWAGPSSQYLFGNDELGRDMFSLQLFSLRNAVIVGVGATLVTLVIGTAVGAAAGLVGGRLDNLLMRVTDVMLAFPTFLFNIILVTILGRGLLVIFVAIGSTSWAGMARLVRAQVLTLKEREYVSAARALGASRLDIGLNYILPNAAGPLIVAVAFAIPNAMMVEAGMSVLGMGVNPPMPSWGLLIQQGAPYILTYPHLLLWPALTFAFTLMSFTFLGDGLRDAFDPQA